MMRRVSGVGVLLLVAVVVVPGVLWAAVQPVTVHRYWGFSNDPTIASGSWIWVNRAVPIEEVQVGEFVVFVDLRTGKRVCHRVREKLADDLLITKGDNNRFRDRLLVGRMAYRGVVIHWED